MTTTISKRTLLTSAGILAVGAALPAWARKAPTAASTYDVIVIGAGTSGLPLAIAAAERGARVLVVERSPVLGGTLDRTSASTSAAGTSFQKAAGIQDTPDDHYDDIMRATEHAADPVLVRLWTRNALDTVNWLMDKGIKFKFSAKQPGPSTGYRVARAQFIEGSGKGLTKVLTPLLDKLVSTGRVKVLLNSRVLNLIQNEKGAVVGLVVAAADGTLMDFPGHNVVITAGGTMANPRMFQDLHCGVPLYWLCGYPFCQGDGLLLGQSAGGYLRGGRDYTPFLGLVMADNVVPSQPTDGTFLETVINGDVPTRPPWEIWVNASGERFVAEDAMQTHYRESVLRQQPGHRLWTVHDQEAFEKAPSPMVGWDRAKYIAGFGSNPMFYKGQTLEQLAMNAGVDPRALKASVDAYNTALTDGTVDPFGRTVRPAPIVKPPYYSVLYQGYHLLSFAGLAVDQNLNVTRRDGSAIPNLYAAGEVLGATAVGASAHCTGAMVTPALTFGRMLGQKILKYPA